MIKIIGGVKEENKGWRVGSCYERDGEGGKKEACKKGELRARRLW